MNTLLALLMTVPQPLIAPAPVRAVTIEGETFEGAWAGMDDNGALNLQAESQTHKLPMNRLMSLQWTTKPFPSHEEDKFDVHLVHGSRLRAKLAGTQSGQPVFETNLVGRLPVKMSELVAIRHLGNASSEAREAFDKAMADRHAAQDTMIIVRDGKVRTLRGVTGSLAPGGTFRWREVDVPIEFTTVYGIVFAAGVQKPVPPPSRCELRDGSTWAGTIAGGNSTHVHMQLPDGPSIEIPVDEIAAIEFSSERVLFLESIKPMSYEFEPFHSTQWPYRVNRSAANRPMRIGSRTFDRGIGVHAKSTLEYELAHPCKQFAATIGIDEGVGSLGNVVFRVIADDKIVFDSGEVTGSDEPRDILVPIEGATSLKLVVDFGKALDIGDQANWANARLIK